MLDRAFVLSLTGERCRKQAGILLESLRRWAEDVPVMVFGDDADWLRGLGVAKWSLIYEAKGDCGDKQHGFLWSGAQKTVFLDADLVCLSDPGLIWRLLDRFDVLAAHAHWRMPATDDAKMPGLMAWNAGLVAWRRSPQQLRVFSRWWERVEALRALSGRHELEEPILAEELVHSELRLFTLPCEWNARFGLGGMCGGGGSIVFSHGCPLLARGFGDRVNAARGIRLFRNRRLL
jgi:hypothetical protein